ncbi:MFS transporter [Deinococcus oregonensis]|uniref:MFS transporter n=1 Tax=Deinococcus oregonensis TaxID=1805970 RepID=A0ABV6AXT4_9DEIO
MTAPSTSVWTAPQRWTLAATVLGSTMAFLDGSVVNVALSALQQEFGATLAAVGWVANAYTLMLAALILVGGALGDLYGRKRMFGLGVGLFALASLLCGLAPQLGVLIGARVLQGIGGALLIPGSLALINGVFPRQMRGRAIGLWSAITSMVLIFGPALGGLLVDTASWRWVFLLNLPLAALVLLALPRVPESRDETRRGTPPDLVGSLLAVAGLGALTSGLITAGERGWNGAALGLTLAGMLGVILFVVWEARSRSPMLPLSLFRSAGFAGTNLLTFLLYGALGSALFFLPLVLIGALGFSATAAGSALLPLSLLLAGLSGVFGGLADRIGPRLPLTVGPILAGIGFALMARIGVGAPYWTTILPAMVTLGLGMAITVAPLTTAVMGSVGASYAGTASGVNNAVSRAAGLLMLALFTLLTLGSFGRSLETRLAGAALPAAARQTMLAQSAQLARVPVPSSLNSAQAAAAQQAVKLAFVDSFRQVALWSALLAVLAGLAGCISLNPKRGPALPTDHPDSV